MFSRRRAKSNPPLRSTQRVPPSPASSAAATAAAQAFLSNRVSNGNLSAAAAAAALRAHITTPVPVGQIQTKRMLQRQASTSSNGSAAGRNARPGVLMRSDSGGSMTERTFREPSPARRPQSRSAEDTPPPMPTIPRGLASPPPLPERSIRRPASVEPPERIGSPPPKVSGGRGVSLDRGPGVMKGRFSRIDAQRPPSLSTFQDAEQSGGRGSINFSRPRSPTSSPTSPTLRDTQVSPTPGGRRINAQNSMAGRAALTAAEVENIQYSVQDTANSPVKKKKRTIVPAMVEGSHLSSGTTGVKPTGTALQQTTQRQQDLTTTAAASTARPTSPSTQLAAPKGLAVKKKKRNAAIEGASIQKQQSGRLSDYSSDSDAGSEQSHSSDRPRSYNTRAAGLLTKQPSIVREDREAEEEEERGSPAVQNAAIARSKRMAEITNTVSKTALPEAAAVQDTASVPVGLQKQPKLAPESASQLTANGAPKRSSLSPARVAHFPDQPLLDPPEGVKHQPPGRSISPAKSALKHSPSSRGSSPGTTMPVGWTRPGQVPSETSDTASVISDDGYRSLSRKKQNRVSFDDVPSVVGRSDTAPSSPDSPIIFSPQSKDSSKKGWFGLGRDKKKEQSKSEKDEDDVIKPMPTLPSFGSVRGRKGSEEQTIVATSSASSSAQGPLGTSDDFNIGGILAQHYGKKANEDALQKPSNEPLPPEVTSVEGSGYHSDEDTDHDVEENVPKISVQPATPGLDESSQQQLGTFGETHKTTEAMNQSRSMSEEAFATQTPSSIGIAEPEPPAVAAYHDPASPVVGEVAHSLQHQITSHDDDDDTEDSIYSDAPEDMSDLEGDGFGSINAIVESPTVSTFPVLPKTPVVPQARALSPLPKDEAAEPRSGERWDKTQSYWSGLSQSRKSQLEDEATPSTIQAITSAPAPQQEKTKKVAAKSTAQPLESQPQSLATRNIKQKPKSEVSTMKKSMRDGSSDSPEVPHMRSSMRGAGPQQKAPRQTTMRNSLPPSGPPEPKGTLQKKLRPVSAVAMVDYNKPENRMTNPRSASGGNQAQSVTPIAPAKRMTSQPIKKATVVASAPRRTFSNGSDSSSSFKKARPAASESGRYTMRRSMRGSSVSEEPKTTPVQASRFSVRSLSPGSRNRNALNSPLSGGMRTSMRGSADLEKSRPSKSPTRSFGFGKSSRAAVSSAKPSSRFSSRFGDSSDDDDEPNTYRSSRFADSSDEDEPTRRPTDLKLTPVRGIPRRIDEGDSTDLEDSAEEHLPRRKKNSVPPQAANLEGVALASGSLRANGVGRDLSRTVDMGSILQSKKAAEKSQKKRSFFGSLGRRKTDDSKIQKADVESAARRDTPLERSKPERELVATASTVQPPKSPKLQRRNTPQRFASDSWPLPQTTTTVTSERPVTSDGLVPTGKRPGLGERQGTAGSVAVSLRTGKKKRFPRLRRAFGLLD